MDNSFWVNYGEYIVGIPALIIGTAVTIWIFIRQKNIKKLEYRIIANENLLSYHKDVEKDLVILFQNQKINNLGLLMLEFKNTGNVPILKSDFELPLVIKLPSTINIFGIEIIDIYPKNLNVDFLIDTGGISMSPCLINPKDKFSIKVITDSVVNTNILNVEGRINGISEVKQSKNFIETDIFWGLVRDIVRETLPNSARKLFDFFFPLKKEKQNK